MFFRGAKATPPFLISNFPFLSFLFSLLLYTLPFPPRRAAHLNLTRGFGEVPPCSRNRKHNKMLKVLTNTTYFGETIPWTPPLQLLSGTSPRPLGIAAYVCKQRKFNYLKLHIQTTNTKRFSPVAIDNIITEFVLCPKILLHAAILQNPTAHSQIPTTHFVSQNTVF